MVHAFFLWWIEQLRAAWPGRAADRAGAGRALVIEPADPGQIAVFQRQAGRLQALGRFAADAAGLAALRRARPGRLPAILLRIAPSLLLSREIALPIAAEADLGAALRLAIDSLTPFAADEVFWSWQVLSRDRLRQQLRVRLDVVPRQAVPFAPILAAAGLPIGGLEIPLLGQAAQILQLRQAAVPLAADRLLAGLCAALMLLAIAVPFAIQAWDLARLREGMAALHAPVLEAEALRRRLHPAGGAEGDRRGEALRLIAAVTEAMPDGTYLTELALRDRTLSITGQSSDAAGLIARLAARPEFRNPSFTAPVTRSANGRADLFALQAGIGP